MKLSVTNPELLHLKSSMLMQVEGFSQSEWQVGKSKIFLRGCVHEPLEEKRQKILNAMSVKIQKTWKGQRQRKRFFLNFCLLRILMQIFQKWANPGLFFIYFRLFYSKYMWKMSIQYTVPGFELMTFGTWVSSHNH